MASEGAHIPRNAVPKAKRPLETKAPKNTSPGALKGYRDIMDKLVPLALSAPGPSGGELEEDRKESQQEEGGTYLDPGLLNYIDKLCSQKDFVIKVEEVIHPQFPAQLLSSEAQLDVLALAEDLLEHEKRLTPIQLVEEQPLASEEECVQTRLSYGAPRLDSSPSESVASQEAQKHDHGPQLGVRDKAFPPETDFKDCQSHSQADTYLSKPKAFAVSSGCQECPPLQALCPLFALQGQRCTYSALGSWAASIPRETPPVRETGGPVGRSSKNEEDLLPCLSFLWASPNSLLPPALSLDPVPASGLACPGDRGPQGAAQSLPQKRRCDQSVTGSWRKRHCSQYGATGCPSCCQALGGPAKM